MRGARLYSFSKVCSTAWTAASSARVVGVAAWTVVVKGLQLWQLSPYQQQHLQLLQHEQAHDVPYEGGEKGWVFRFINLFTKLLILKGSAITAG